MPRSILIPMAIDDDRLAARKIALARKLLDPGGRITLLTVLEAIPSFVAEFVTVKTENRLTEKILARLEQTAGGAPDIDCAVVQGKPGIRIVDHATENGCDLIVVGAHNPTAGEYFLGSTAARVARRAKCAVHILR